MQIQTVQARAQVELDCPVLEFPMAPCRSESPRSVTAPIEAMRKAEKSTRTDTPPMTLAKKPSLLERVSRFADTTTEPVVVTAGTDGSILYCNDSWVTMCGYTREEALGRTNRELLQGADTDMVVGRELSAALAEGATEVNATLWNYKKGGEGFWNDLQVQRLDGVGTECTLFVGFLKEVGGEPAEEEYDNYDDDDDNEYDESERLRKTEVFRFKKLFSQSTGHFRDVDFLKHVGFLKGAGGGAAAEEVGADDDICIQMAHIDL